MSGKFLFVLLSLLYTYNLCFKHVTDVDNTSQNDDKSCVMYDMKKTSPNEPSKTIAQNISPQELDDEGVALLAELCPFLAVNKKKNNTKIKTCCSTKQLNYFNNEASELSFFAGSCPSCKFAMLTFACNMICNPEQANFLNVTDKTDTNIVEAVTYYLAKDYPDKIFDSCKELKMIEGTKFIQTMCPDGLNISKCNGVTIVNFMAGRNENFNVNIVVSTENENHTSSKIKPLSSWVPNCNTTDIVNDISINKCSRRDCATIPDWLPMFPNECPVAIRIFGFLSYWQFFFLLFGVSFMIIMFIVGCILYFNFGCCKSTYSRRSSLLIVEETSDINIDGLNPSYNLIQDDNVSKDLNQEQAECSSTNILVTHVPDRGITKCLRFLLLKITRLSLNYPLIVIICVSMVCIILSICIPFFLQITTDPIDLWSPSNSEFHKQKVNFDSNFGKFYRTEQIIISNKNESLGITLESLKLVYKIVSELQLMKTKFKVSYNDSYGFMDVTLSDLCLKPLSPISNECVIYSVMQYFQNDNSLLIDDDDDQEWKDHLITCLNSPTFIPLDPDIGTPCLSTFLQPINPKLVVGDYNNDEYITSNTLIITVVVINPTSKQDIDKTLLWEKQFIEYSKNLTINNPNYTISFSSERSIQDEVGREANSNILIVIISYLVMFIYVSISLGKIPRYANNILIDTKVCLGFGGVVLVFLSVTTSIGLLSLFGVKMNTIALEVLPFLILAVGVDNMFIISHAYYRAMVPISVTADIVIINNDVDICVTSALQKVGPGIIISAISQCVIFSLGTISNIPVIRTFALFATIALLINFILQMTVFLSLFVLDSRREYDYRYNILCCIKSKDAPLLRIGDPDRYYMGPARWFVKTVISKIVLNEKLRLIVFTLFITIWVFSLSIIPSIHVGLDQTLALPKDSYLQTFFKDMFNKTKFGAPVYYVIGSGYEYQKPEQQNRICYQFYCGEDSLTNSIYLYSKYSNTTRISSSAMSWIDVYLQWLNPIEIHNKYCCGIVSEIKNHTKYPNVKIGDFCVAEYYSNVNDIKCKPCLTKEIDIENRPTSEQFGEYLPHFLDDVPDIKGCSYGGKAAFKNSVVLNQKYYDKSSDFNKSHINPIITTNIMTYHTPLFTSDDFVDAIRKSIHISTNLTSSLGVNVYPYSVFYIFYEAYLDMRSTCYKSMGICCAAVLMSTCFLFNGNIRMTFIVGTTVIFMNIVNFAFMYVANLELNPVSIVNLIMLFAINIEFVSHVAFAYISCPMIDRVQKAHFALISSGGSVFSGIALTKIIGISVLAFASSEIFKLYYFRMYMFAVVVGAFHGLLFLPIFLSYCGPRSSHQ